MENAAVSFTLSATSTSSHLLCLLHGLSTEYQVKCKVPILIFMAIHGSGSRYLKSALFIMLVTSLNNCCQFQGSPEQNCTASARRVEALELVRGADQKLSQISHISEDSLNPEAQSGFPKPYIKTEERRQKKVNLSREEC